MDSADIRARNRAAALRLILTRRCVTRSALARATGLTRMTVGSIVDELRSAEVISELSRRNSTVGRPRQLLRLDPRGPVVVGIQLSPVGIHGGVADLSLRVLGAKPEYLNTIETPRTIIRKIDHFIRDMLTRFPRRPLGIGISADGDVDPVTGDFVNLKDLYGIERLSLVGELADRFKIPVLTVSSLEAATRAEMTFGAAQQVASFGAVVLFEHVGLALVSNGEIVGPPAVDGFGHTSVDRSGALCRCGSRGCLEGIIGNREIVRRVSELTGSNLRRARQAYVVAETHPGANEHLRKVLDNLAHALGNVSKATGVTHFVLECDAVHLPDVFLSYLTTKIEEQIAPNHITIRRSRFGDGGGFFGAAGRVITEIIEGRLPFVAGGAPPALGRDAGRPPLGEVAHKLPAVPAR